MERAGEGDQERMFGLDKNFLLKNDSSFMFLLVDVFLFHGLYGIEFSVGFFPNKEYLGIGSSSDD